MVIGYVQPQDTEMFLEVVPLWKPAESGLGLTGNQKPLLQLRTFCGVWRKTAGWALGPGESRSLGSQDEGSEV